MKKEMFGLKSYLCSFENNFLTFSFYIYDFGLLTKKEYVYYVLLYDTIYMYKRKHIHHIPTSFSKTPV